MITRNHQVTPAVYPVTRDTSKVATNARCLDAITSAGLTIRAFCLDRAFSAHKVIAFLTTAKVPFNLPVRKHSRAMKRLLGETQSRCGDYSLRRKPSLHLTIVIAVTYANGKRGRHGVENIGDVVNSVPGSPRRIHETSRSRFAIESSYRIRNQVKPRTSARNLVIRELFAIISFLLTNLCMKVLWT